MRAANPVLPPPPALARGEIIAITLLVLAGIGGGVVAYRDLAAREADIAAEEQKRALVLEQARADGASLGQESEALLVRLKGIVAAPPAPATATPGPALESAGGGSGANPLPPAKLAALNHLVDLVQKGVLATQAMSTGTALGMAGLPGQKLPAYMIDGQGKLAPGFGELFGLGEAEITRLQTIISDLKQRADEFVLGRTAVRPAENGYVLEYVPAEGMAEMRDAGVAAMKSVLGEERYRIFAVLNGERPADNGTTTGGPAAWFDAAGGTQRTITLTRTPTGVSYTLTSGPNGARSGSGSMGGGDLATVLTNRFGPVARLLPQDFIDSIPRSGAGRAGGDAVKLEVQTRTAVPNGGK